MNRTYRVPDGSGTGRTVSITVDVPDAEAIGRRVHAEGGDGLAARHAAQNAHAAVLEAAGIDKSWLVGGEDGIGDAGDRAVRAWLEADGWDEFEGQPTGGDGYPVVRFASPDVAVIDDAAAEA